MLAALWDRAGGSLTARLLRGMVLPMAGLALLLGIGGALAIRSAVETVNDRILGAASRAIAESLTVEDGEIALNLSPAIFGMIEDTAADLGRVMTRFSRLDRGAPREGSGLGLSIAEALAQAIGAELTLDAASNGRGLLARVRFPREAPIPDSIVTASPVTTTPE